MGYVPIGALTVFRFRGGFEVFAPWGVLTRQLMFLGSTARSFCRIMNPIEKGGDSCSSP